MDSKISSDDDFGSLKADANLGMFCSVNKFNLSFLQGFVEVQSAYLLNDVRVSILHIRYGLDPIQIEEKDGEVDAVGTDVKNDTGGLSLY